MTALLALALKLVGTGFLVVATIGVLRFEDPFQRMHASTKAGTLGAGLVLIGVMLTQGSTGATIIAMLTLIFLIATMPVAGHLLGRAAYVSGAPLRTREDALAGVLPRAEKPLEERTILGFVAPAPAASAETAVPAPAPESLRDALSVLDEEPYESGFDSVRFAVIAPHAGLVTRRAMKLAASRHAPLTAVAVIDRDCVESARVPDARDVIRAKLAGAIDEMQRETEASPHPLALAYEEGDPLALIPSPSSDSRELLVLPSDGWCHHGAGVTLPVFEERLADKLFTVARRHEGPTLFVGCEEDAARKRLVVMHDGSRRAQRLAAWALNTRLWPVAEVTIVGPASREQVDALAAVAADARASVAHVRKPKAAGGAMLPARYADAAAVIMPDLPRRASGYGGFWQDAIIPGWRGDVLV
ncbi:monovalent cation/H(+) antiporter subunit G [Salinarimonas rosea]|uniref:monovalent cation/H(+) antiporter subunit G n=1 Tax=Salinarimonas rosea TaxID=552063 RepID=UPI000414DC67|nr:monovalent cation/H(+) antiporter subunit G [Salinarimonas rosea]